jgi:hypothetical protein
MTGQITFKGGLSFFILACIACPVCNSRKAGLTFFVRRVSFLVSGTIPSGKTNYCSADFSSALLEVHTVGYFPESVSANFTYFSMLELP